MTNNREKGAGADRRALLQGMAALGMAAPFTTTFAILGDDVALAQSGKRGGSLNTIINPEPPIAVPGVNNQTPTLIVGSKIFQGLLTYNSKLEPQPELAKSWSVSPDGLTYTFNLQENVKWHDGKPFSADDVIFSITKYHMELNPRSRAIFQRITSATAPDAKTVVLKLNAPFEPFLLMFDVTTCVIAPKHLYDGVEMRNAPANQSPVGTGPFKFKEWRRGSMIHLVRNEDYWKPGQPYLDEIFFRVIPDSNLRGLALQSGQVQMTSSNDIEPFDIPRFRQQPNLDILGTGWELFAPVSWVDLNHRSKPLDDVRVRRALSMALDRDYIHKFLWFGVGKPASSAIASATRFHDASVRLPAFNQKAAAELLDLAGYKAGPGGVRFELKFMPLPYGEIWNRLGEYIRQSFAQIGVKLNAEAVDAATWSRKMANWEYDVSVNFVYQWGDPTLGVERTYVSTNIQKVAFTNTMGYSNPKVDELFKTAREALKSEDRAKAFSDVQKILAEEMPVLWLMEMTFPTIIDKRLKNVVAGGTGVHGSFDTLSFA